jgi:UDP:flavonoid glycosyltransferase YjiC (YdhE family)
MHACGFVRAGHHGTSAPSLPDELETFLAGGDPPVVIALGSIFSLGSDALVADVAHSCAELGERCVLVGPTPRVHALPDATFVVPYAAYHLLFPRAATLVIHGGAGTTGEALRSGRPTVVVPLAFDQFALGWQIERLETGINLPKRGRSRATIRAALERSFASKIDARARAVGEELAGAPDGAERIADHVRALS